MSDKPVFQIRPNEQITFERKMVLQRLGAMSVRNSYLTITSERIIFEQGSRFSYGMMFGLLGVLLAKRFPG